MAKSIKTNLKIPGIERLRPGKSRDTKELGKERIEALATEPQELLNEQVAAQGSGQVVIVTPQKSVVYDVKSETLKKIETILEEGFEDIFYRLSASEQSLVKQEGERAARSIEEVLLGAKSTAVKIFNIIRRWLEFVPGLNRLFLEQESKIKTDKIMRLKP